MSLQPCILPPANAYQRPRGFFKLQPLQADRTLGVVARIQRLAFSLCYLASMTTTSILINTAGWIASILLVAAYWLVSKNKISAQSALYQSMNLIGSALLIVNTAYYGAFPSTAVNIIWVVIGAFYLLKSKKEKTGSRT